MNVPQMYAYFFELQQISDKKIGKKSKISKTSSIFVL